MTITPASLQATPAERRRHDRHPIEAVITATSQSNFWCGFSENLSEGGVFVATPNAPPSCCTEVSTPEAEPDSSSSTPARPTAH